MEDGKTVFDWGQGSAVAPSIRRARPFDWLAGSIVAGLFVAAFAMSIAWKDWAWLPAPPGALSEHATFAFKSLVHAAGRHWFALEARQYREALDRFNDGQWFALGWRCAIGFLAFLLPGALTFRAAMKGRDGLIHLRGSTRHAGEEAKRQLNAELKLRAKARPDHEIAPGIPYPGDLWTRHVLVVGGTGSGKSTAIKPLISKVVAAKEQMLLFDPKGEFTENFPEPSIIAPWDKRSLSWDIAKDMRNQIDMRRFAASMIKESQDPMWSNASRQLLVGLMIYLKKTRGNEWGWQELADMVSLPQDKLLGIMGKYHPEAVRSVEKASVTTSGILINLAAFCSSIFDLAEAWGAHPQSKRVSFVDWTLGRSGRRQLILQGHGSYGELTKSYVEGIVGIISAIVNSVEMKDDWKRKIWFIADEFGQMGKIPVRPLFEVGRSRGVRCVVACQDFAQLEEIYGAQMVKALVGMSGSLLVGQIMQGETAEALCKAFGAREVERGNMSSSVSGGTGQPSTLSFSRDEVPLYKPSELTSRLGLARDGKHVTLLLFTGGHGYELQWPLFPMVERRLRYVAADWTDGLSGVLPSSVKAPSREAAFVAPQAAVDKVLAELDEMAGAALAAKPSRVDGNAMEPVGSVANAIASERARGGQASQSKADGGSAKDESGQDADPSAEAEGPATEIVVKAVPERGPDQDKSLDPAHAADQGRGAEVAEPEFDAMAELALIKAGIPMLALAIEASTAKDAASSQAAPSKHEVAVSQCPSPKKPAEQAKPR